MRKARVSGEMKIFLYTHVCVHITINIQLHIFQSLHCLQTMSYLPFFTDALVSEAKTYHFHCTEWPSWKYIPVRWGQRGEDVCKIPETLQQLGICWDFIQRSHTKPSGS